MPPFLFSTLLLLSFFSLSLLLLSLSLPLKYIFCFCCTFRWIPRKSHILLQYNPMKTRISNSSSLLKQEFLKKWIKGVQIYSNLNKNMTISDRKNAIKLSADVAIASTRSEATNWSQALMHDAVSTNRTSRIVVEQILGRRVEEKKAASVITCSKRILSQSRGYASRRRKATRVESCGYKARSSFSIAKKLVKKRTSVLKRLVPGGERIMDEFSLIKETLDYIVSLRVQVDVMRHYLAGAADQRSETLNI